MLVGRLEAAVELKVGQVRDAGLFAGREALAELALMLARQLDCPGPFLPVAATARELRATLEDLEVGLDGDGDDADEFARWMRSEMGDAAES